MSSQSSTTGNVLGAIGAVVGGIYGGPVGAAQGYAIGSALGNALDPPKGPTQVGPRLEDKSVQTSTYGATIPRIYGTCKVAGNVFWLEKDQLKEVVKKESSGGKGGGGGAEVKTYTYYATFAVGLCRGPISAVRRIWAGPNLIYDAGSGDLESMLASNSAADGFRIYYGTESQQPDSRMQADKGIDNTPAYRGLAYIVFYDFALEKYGNSLAQAQIQVELVKDGQSYAGDLFNIEPEVQAITGYSYADGLGVDPDLIEHGYHWNEGTGTAYAGRIRYGVSKTTDNAILTPDKVGSATGVFAFDGDAWVQYGSSRFSNPRVATSLSGKEVQNTLGQGNMNYFWPVGTSAGVTEYRCVIANASATGTLAFFARLYFQDGTGYAVTSGIIGATTNYRPVSTGDRPTAYQVSANTCLLRVLNDDFSLDYTDTIPLPVGVVNDVSGATGNSPTQNRAFFLGDTFYIAAVNGGVITILGMKDSQVVSNYSFTPSTPISGIACFYLKTPDQGIVSSDRVIHFRHFVDGGQTLSGIVSAESQLSNLIEPTDIVFDGLADTVTGYKVSSVGSIRNGIEPLRGAWPFDVIQDGYQIKFRDRGQSSVATIDIGELGVSEQIREVREMDSQIARKVVVKYLDKARDYDVNEQYDQRENTDSVNTLSMDLPVVLTSTEAKRVAQKLLYLYWLERSDFTFTLPPEYVYLQPSDVVTIVDDATTYALRIGSIKYMEDGRLECSAKANNAAVYTSIADTDGGLIPPVTIPFPGDSIGLLLDIPVIDETLQNTAGFVGYMTGETTGWTGGAHFVTSDNGQTWSVLQAYAGKGTIGTVRGALSAHPGTLIQSGGSITVDLYSGQLEGISESQMLNGKNYAAYGADGRWEIIRFQNAALNADGSYTLDTFIRGDRGTEWATGLHVAGDIFCLMDDPDGSFIYTNTASIGVPRTVRAVTSGANVDSADNESFTYHGVNLECYSPVYGKGARDGSDNLTISWIRRTRIGGEWRSNVDASLGETSEAYEVDIMNGSTVVRTLNSTSQSVAYSAADQTTDFGAPQTSVTCRIYQMSATVGRGYPLEVTV